MYRNHAIDCQVVMFNVFFLCQVFEPTLARFKTAGGLVAKSLSEVSKGDFPY